MSRVVMPLVLMTALAFCRAVAAQDGVSQDKPHGVGIADRVRMAVEETLDDVFGLGARAWPRLRNEVEGVEHFRIESPLLTRYWGRTIAIEAGVVLPPSHDPAARDTPMCYSIHGFGGSHRPAWRMGRKLRELMDDEAYPRMIYVFLNASCALGHHEFADSVNNGPLGQALITEFIPALERKFGAVAEPRGRFLTGHSSGGWSSLWLQVTYPEFFGGVWSTAPDPVDFRDFSGVDIYTFKNAYYDASGEEIPLVRRAGGGWAMTIKQYAQHEAEHQPYGGQFGSFDAVFSPRGEDGRPMPLFDRRSGKIDRLVAAHWRNFDIRLILKNHWATLGPKLQGKLHIFTGTEDTYRLEGAVKLLKEELESLGSDAQVVVVDGRDHGSLFAAHDELWPDGLQKYIHDAMWTSWKTNAPHASPLLNQPD